MVRRYFVLGLAVTTSLALAGCEVRDNDARPTSITGSSATTTSDTEFSSKFQHRRNGGNDGTSYEPCVSLTAASMQALNIDPDSRSDAALVDNQTARGCNWRYLDSRWLSASQIVGNNSSLAHYRSTQPSAGWRPDLVIGGRPVAINQTRSTMCATHVMSGQAIVSTMVRYATDDGPTIDEICDRAIAFTKATIDKMPP